MLNNFLTGPLLDVNFKNPNILKRIFKMEKEMYFILYTLFLLGWNITSRKYTNLLVPHFLEGIHEDTQHHFLLVFFFFNSFFSYFICLPACLEVWQQMSSFLCAFSSFHSPWIVLLHLITFKNFFQSSFVCLHAVFSSG